MTLHVGYIIVYPQRLAGANRSLFELVTHLPKHIVPHVAITAEGPVAQAYRDAGVEVTVWSLPPGLHSFGGEILRRSWMTRLWIAFSGAPRVLWQFGRWLRLHSITVVHTNDPRGTLLFGLFARLLGRKLVAHLRGEFALSALWRWPFERLPTRIVAVSKGAALTLTPAGQRKTQVVYNGIAKVPAELRAPSEYLERFRSRGGVVVGCFASVVPFKGHHHLIRAVARLQRQPLPPFVVLCIGDFVEGYEAYHRYVEELLTEQGVRCVTFAGWQKDPFAWYSLCDLTVLPSVSTEELDIGGTVLHVRGGEGFPRTHLEAMAYGLPIVGTSIAGVPEQVAHEETGLLVPPGDDEALAAALGRLIADSALRDRYGSAAKKRVGELFSTTAYVQHIAKLYEQLTKSS